ncbi:MAG: hypothetical protein K0S86_461 [Geminicoccaceae bacterium]|nr:hypothetical protein [Geminicoccaceae bacterium]
MNRVTNPSAVMRSRSVSVALSGLIAVGALSVASCAAPAAASQELASGHTPASRELSAEEQATHVLNRLAFGARPGDVGRVRAMGVDAWIARQLEPNRIDDRDMDRFLSHYETLGKSSAELYREYPPGAIARAAAARRDSLARDGRMTTADTLALLEQVRRSNVFLTELTSSRVARAVMSDRQLQEVMVDFWENHFAVFAGKGQTRWYLTSYDRDVIRPHALGKFRELLGAVAKSPAMLFYLDNVQSVADSGRRTLRAARSNGARDRRSADSGPIVPASVGERPRAGRPGIRLGTGSQRRGTDSADESRSRTVAATATAAQRRRLGLNENYARELMELHTLGVDGGYTQRDVVEVARALTGWSIRPPRQLLMAAPGARGRRVSERPSDTGAAGTFVFRPEVHDAEPKVVLGHKLDGGRGIEDGEDVLDILARHPSTARFIARKLAVRFVSDEPPQELVDRAAATFRRTNGDIREVVRTIVTSPEFFSRAAFRAKVKSPFELVVSTMRALGSPADPTPRSAQFIARLGQPIFGHQAPNGWPETAAPWMNTGAILSRINFGMAAAASRVPGTSVNRWPEAARLRSLSRTEQVEGVIASLLGGHVSRETREILTRGVNPMAAQAAPDSSASRMLDPDATSSDDSAMAGEAGNRRRMTNRGLGTVPELSGLAQVVGLALGSPEFQRR